MNQVVLMFGVFCLVVGLLAYGVIDLGVIWIPDETGSVTDRFGQHYEEFLIQNRPFEQVTITLGILGIIMISVGVALKETEKVQDRLT